MKLSAQELRIGNYFLYDNRIQVVNGVIDINGGYRIDFKTEHKRKLVKYCHPIPLTEEWLLKFGWVWNEECNSYEKYPNGDARMNLTETSFGYVMFNYVLKAKIRKGIYYVHQLQNLYFALTGEELILNK